MEVSEKVTLKAILELHKEIEKAFRKLWSSIPPVQLKGLCLDPPADVVDLGDKYVIRIDIPGFKRNEVKIRVGEEFIQVSAEKKEEFESEGGNYIVRQRIYEKAYKELVLPEKIKPNPREIQVKYEDGVLEITVPKAGYAKEIELRPQD
ncbi:MAG: hypothetical protein DRJ52_03390 [Thermoprotei archaeon]|nr:MAG: hypothetical protein DRJ52_03390 [Thermoprotei archaeon]RLE99836.1 MAG: hypothetical protein DRJ63_04180 [Thermoprotei archaeon]HDI75467.1 Hsp20/alpha crystallin family protein [Thermoprotei archaeon]